MRPVRSTGAGRRTPEQPGPQGVPKKFMQRYLKVVKPKNPDGSLKNSGFWTFTYYQHDAQGNVLAVYDIKNADEECGYEMYLDQLVLYGSSRLGVLNQKLKMGTMEHSFPGYGGGGMYVCLDELELDDDLMLGAVPATSPGGIFNQSPGGKIEAAKPWELVQNPATVKPLTVFGVTNPPINVAGPAKEETKYEPGNKQYEFSNHLGNVLVTVSDLPLGVDIGTNGTVDYYMPNVLTTSDYEPFGAPLEGRTLSENGGYEFAFNGKERDDEGMGGGGSTYDYGFRIYNPQIGKFLSVDPLTSSYPWYTPYQYSGNNPIKFVDLDGLERKPHDKDWLMSDAGAGPVNMEPNLIDRSSQMYAGESLKYIEKNLIVLLDAISIPFQLIDRMHMDKNNGGNVSTERLDEIYPETKDYTLADLAFDYYVGKFVGKFAGNVIKKINITASRVVFNTNRFKGVGRGSKALGTAGENATRDQLLATFGDEVIITEQVYMKLKGGAKDGC